MVGGVSRPEERGILNNISSFVHLKPGWMLNKAYMDLGSEQCNKRKGGEVVTGDLLLEIMCLISAKCIYNFRLHKAPAHHAYLCSNCSQ